MRCRCCSESLPPTQLDPNMHGPPRPRLTAPCCTKLGPQHHHDTTRRPRTHGATTNRQQPD
eukprot:8696516-Lingulodinium_polyedra.AAC.1